MIRLDRTYEGLKQFYANESGDPEISLDRTYEGLKLSKRLCDTSEQMVWIVPMRD
mgnify:CR=1 FL=1